VKVASSISWVAGNNLLKVAVRIAILAVLSRLLDPEDFGKAAAVALVMGFGDIAAEFGIYSSLVQRPTLNREFVATATWVSLAVTMCVTTAIWFFASPLEGFLKAENTAEMLRFAAFAFLPQGLSITPRALIHRDGHFRFLSITESSTYLLTYAPLALGMAYAGFGAWSLVVPQAVQSVIQCALYVWKAKLGLAWTFQLSAIREILDRTFAMSTGRVADYFGQQGDNIVVARVFGVDMLGFYSRAFTLMKMPTNVLGSALQTVLFPKFSRLQDDLPEVRATLLSGLEVLSALLLPASVFLVMNAELCVDIFLGRKWLQVVPIFQILGIGMFFRMSSKFLDAAVAGFGLFWTSAFFRFIYAGIICGGAWFSVRWGMTGVAFSTVVGIVVMNGLLSFAVQRRCGLPTVDILRVCLPGVQGAILAILCGWGAYHLASCLVSGGRIEAVLALVVQSALFAGVVIMAPARFLPATILGKLSRCLPWSIVMGKSAK
jgi:PST family polysaccharide transporter